MTDIYSGPYWHDKEQLYAIERDNHIAIWLEPEQAMRARQLVQLLNSGAYEYDGLTSDDSQRISGSTDEETVCMAQAK